MKDRFLHAHLSSSPLSREEPWHGRQRRDTATPCRVDANRDHIGEATRRCYQGRDRLDPDTLATVINHYLGALAKGTTDNLGQSGELAGRHAP
jgi:hypothetical protein